MDNLVCNILIYLNWHFGIFTNMQVNLLFSSNSAGKESTCNARDLASIPGLGRPLEKGKAVHSSILAYRIPWTE